jgi:hypothetical protein
MNCIGIAEIPKPSNRPSLQVIAKCQLRSKMRPQALQQTDIRSLKITKPMENTRNLTKNPPNQKCLAYNS